MSYAFPCNWSDAAMAWCRPGVMPRFPARTRRVILSNFRRKSTNTGQRIRRYSLATPGIIRAGQQCLKLQQKMRNASLFNKGYEMSELLSAALLDMRWHCLKKPSNAGCR